MTYSFSTLPSEILTFIFEYASSEANADGTDTDIALATYRSVCSFWNNVIYNMPRDIQVSHRNLNELQCKYLFFIPKITSLVIKLNENNKDLVCSSLSKQISLISLHVRLEKTQLSNQNWEQISNCLSLKHFTLWGLDLKEEQKDLIALLFAKLNTLAMRYCKLNYIDLFENFRGHLNEISFLKVRDIAQSSVSKIKLCSSKVEILQ